MTRVVVGALGLAGCVVATAVALFFPNAGPSGRFVDRVLDLLAEATAPFGLGVVGVETLANVLVFIPLGAFGAMVLPRRLWWIAVLGALLLSTAAETVQALMLSSRVGSVRDVVLNVTGALIGAGSAWAVRRVLARRRTT